MHTPLNVWNSYYGANKTTDTPWVDWREVNMATDFSTTATQALTERYGHTAQQIWGTQRAFPAGPVRVHLTDVSVGQVTNVGFVDRTFIFASYLIGLYRVGTGITGRIRINKFWGQDPGFQTILSNNPAGTYRMITQLDYVRVGADGKNLDLALPAECRASFRVIAG
jgi:hypothetical protein